MIKKIFTVLFKLAVRRQPLKGIFIFLIVLSSHALFAQTSSIRASASLDTNKIRIGEQVQLSFDVTAPKDVLLFFPYMPDTLQNIEVVERFAIDTMKGDDAGSARYHQKIIITCFDP